MCMCGKPTINGEPGYSWNGENKPVRKPDPPELANGDDLLFDELARCGGIDARSRLYRLVKYHSQRYLLVKPGGGTSDFCCHHGEYDGCDAPASEQLTPASGS